MPGAAAVEALLLAVPEVMAGAALLVSQERQTLAAAAAGARGPLMAAAHQALLFSAINIRVEHGALC
jgi:hypothetical protein